MTRILPQHALGGMQKQTMDLCEGFVESGHRVTILQQKEMMALILKKIRVLMSIIYLLQNQDITAMVGKKRVEKIQQLHAESPIDVIHSQSLGARYVINWAKKNNIPIVSTWHGTSLTEISTFFASASKHPRFWHWLFIMPYRMLKQYLTMDLAVRRASKVITLVSPTLEKNMKLFAKNKVITIPNGITIPEEDKRNDNKKIEMISLGRIEKEKGMHFAVQAVSKLNEMDREKVHLNIVGEGPYLESIRELIEHLELDQYITCHGRLSDENLDAMFNRCQIHIMPTTRQEGLPLTILEGMAYGLATIASDIGGISGVITHEFDGFLIKPGNVDELTNVLVKIINDKEERISTGQNARGTILEKYSKERMVNETLHEIITVVES